MKTPIVAIVGRPNVGKSTLFNRVVNKRIAITSEIAGTTRDRLYYRTEINEIPIILADTGGIEYGKKENIEASIQVQVKMALNDADVIVFVIDNKEGLTIEDIKAADALRKSSKNIIFVANKAEDGESEHIGDFLKLGFGEPIYVSAYHNNNIEELTEAIVKKLKSLGANEEKKDENDNAIKIGFVGKPNVGKSSLFNALVGEEKVIVSNIPGTTRDSVDTDISYKDQKITIIDTAGLRRPGKIDVGLEKFSMLRTLNAIERADICCLTIDYTESVRKQDLSICSYILEAGKGLVILVNKVDLMENRELDEEKFINILRRNFDFLPWAPVIFVSAVKHTNIKRILDLAIEINKERTRVIPQIELTEFMKEIVYKHPHPSSRARPPMFYDLVQLHSNPPTFLFKVSNAENIHFSYKRYLENEIRNKYKFTGTAIKLAFGRD